MMTTRQRALIAGSGALAPLLLNLIVVDAHTMFSNVTPGLLAGYFVKVGALFATGAAVAWLHDKETDKKKLFQLGIAAPSLLLTLQNGVQAAKHADEGSNGATAAGWVTGVFSPREAFAQGASAPKAPTLAAPPDETFGEQFLRGLLSQPSRGQTFASLRETFTDYAAAKKTSDELKTKGLKPTVYMTAADSMKPHYSVVLQAWANPQSALNAAAAARAKGVDVLVATKMELMKKQP